MFTKDLYYGLVSSDVYRLQQFLEDKGYGDFLPTGIFGPKTKEAVIKYQKHKNIEPSVGYFGRITRASVNAELSFDKQETLHRVAYSFLGQDASPLDNAPDEFACAETVNWIHREAFGDYIGGGASTYLLYKALLNRNDFIKVDTFGLGDIIISPTGYGNGKVSNGHVGICSTGLNNDTVILSNNSKTGLLDNHLTIKMWRERYEKKGGYPVHFFRKI